MNPLPNQNKSDFTTALLRNIGKVFVLPHHKSPQYRSLYNELSQIVDQVRTGKMDRQQAANLLHQMFSTMNKIATPKENRVVERISTITSMLDTRNLSPGTILDLGAGKGDITIALKNHYNLPSSDVFAIDQKLPDIPDITPLTYIDGKIPLPDNTIDLIIIFVVLHHIPPEVRPSIMSEISRILSPNGVVIIREHDNDGTQDFYIFLDLMHLFWYLAFDETPDPLYLLSRGETQKLFDYVGLESVGYTTYPGNNPQHLYHEMFAKRRPVDKNVEPLPYKFADTNAQQAVQTYINKIRTAPPTYESFTEFVPPSVQHNLNIKYRGIIPVNISSIWPEIVKETALAIILNSVQYSDVINGIRYITSESVAAALQSML
jgi:ubiquinone/menaquinone biosynthesis C-methylase UbiE